MIRILHGDCREVLATLPDASVQCCVTSPPYWGLRDYGVAGQIGLEQSPDAYVGEMVAVFREVRRVLRDDGTLWLNLGDSYSSSPPGNKTVGVSARSGLHGVNDPSGKYRETLAAGHQTKRDTSKIDGIKPKDLIGIPWMVAFALRADGWYLRSDIIWAKPNPMPESVTDRPTSAHEHVFLLTKQARYFYDAEAIKEPGEMKPQNRFTDGKGPKAEGYAAHRQPTGMTECENRNARNVWSIATKPFADAHFATFPPDLAERCISAGTSERGCCAGCGAPWRRAVGRQEVLGRPNSNSIRGQAVSSRQAGSPQRGSVYSATHTLGWGPTCQCDAPVVPCTVLDPFAGAFTTAMVADRLQRNAIGIELNPEYCTMAERRLVRDAGMFADLETS